MPNKTPPHHRPKKKPSPKASINTVKHFSSFADVVEDRRECVFLIIRLRGVQGGALPKTLGTGFLCAPYRLMTCSHVLNDPIAEDELSKHQPGDRYLFLNISGDIKDAFGFYKVLELDKNYFDYPTHDAAIIHLTDDEYKDSDTGRVLHDPNKFIPLSKNLARLGSDAAVLGYPLQALKIDAAGQPDTSEIFIRVDKGIINAAHAKYGLNCYEFTMPFNPGNSGGPIIDPATGVALAYVKGYRPTTIKYELETVPKEVSQQQSDIDILSAVKTIYSVGLATESLVDIAKENKFTLF